MVPMQRSSHGKTSSFNCFEDSTWAKTCGCKMEEAKLIKGHLQKRSVGSHGDDDDDDAADGDVKLQIAKQMTRGDLQQTNGRQESGE